MFASPAVRAFAYGGTSPKTQKGYLRILSLPYTRNPRRNTRTCLHEMSLHRRLQFQGILPDVLRMFVLPQRIRQDGKVTLLDCTPSSAWHTVVSKHSTYLANLAILSVAE